MSADPKLSDLVERWCESTTELRRLTVKIIEEPTLSAQHAITLQGLMAVDHIRSAAVSAHLQAAAKHSAGALLLMPAEGNA